MDDCAFQAQSSTVFQKLHLNPPPPEFVNTIKQKWDEIDVNTINNIIDSMPKRLQEVITNKGKQISY